MTPGGTGSIAYRPEIDGLRAIAVMLVILSHANVPGVAGGYLGVDLFFAISGYLIIGILARELDGGTFSARRFYLRRIRRILPALLLMLFLTLPFALWLMLPEDLRLHGQMLMATAVFANNMLLTMLGAYWGPAITFVPLVHSWSLGVEEQFYLIAPVFIWLAWRIGGRRAMIGAALIVALLSFASALFLNTFRESWSFYLLVPRAWELCAGAMVALTEAQIRPRAGRRAAMWLTALGLALIFAIVAVTPYGTPPGPRAAVLIAGTGLILMFGTTDGPVGRLLTLRPMLFTGLISYSLYLFHQPAFAFLRLTTRDAPGMWAHLALVPLVFLLAWLSWRYVERPFRNPARTSTRAVLLATGGGTVAAILIGLALFRGVGEQAILPSYASYQAIGREPNVDYLIATNAHRQTRLTDRRDRIHVLAIGDSFARDFINMGRENGVFTRHEISLQMAQRCDAPTPELIADARRADFIVIAYRYQARDVPCLVQMMRSLSSLSRGRLIVLGRKQFGRNNAAAMRVPEPARFDFRAVPDAESRAANVAARKLISPGTLIDLERIASDGRETVRIFTPDRQFVSFDTEHLTPAGARWLGGLIFREPPLSAMREAGEQ